MYNSKRIAKNKLILTKDIILSKIDEYDIYAKYIGKFKIGNIYNSPFRKDKNPSFGIYVGRNNKLLFKDYGSGQKGDVFDFVKILKNLDTFENTLRFIYDDLSLNNKESIEIKVNRYNKPKDTNIGIVRQDFTETDKIFWSQFGISINTLKKFDVFSIKYYLCNGIVKGIYKNDNPMYAYKVYNRFKIYRPYGDKFTKWRNNLTEYDIQGYKQLPENGNLLIITKSMKDVMCLYEMGYNAISPSSESTFIPDKALNILKNRFKTILLCFDRDIPGIKNMRRIKLKTGINGFLIHKKFKAKDISDAIKNNSFDTIKDWLNKNLNTYL